MRSRAASHDPHLLPVTPVPLDVLPNPLDHLPRLGHHPLYRPPVLHVRVRARIRRERGYDDAYPALAEAEGDRWRREGPEVCEPVGERGEEDDHGCEGGIRSRRLFGTVDVQPERFGVGGRVGGDVDDVLAHELVGIAASENEDALGQAVKEQGEERGAVGVEKGLEGEESEADAAQGGENGELRQERRRRRARLREEEVQGCWEEENCWETWSATPIPEHWARTGTHGWRECR